MNYEQQICALKCMTMKNSTNSYMDIFNPPNSNNLNHTQSFNSANHMKNFLDDPPRKSSLKSGEYSLLLPDKEAEQQAKITLGPQLRQRMSLFESFYLPFYNSRKNTEEEFQKNRMQLRANEFFESDSDSNDDSLSYKTNASNLTHSRIQDETLNKAKKEAKVKDVFVIEKIKKGEKKNSDSHKCSTERTEQSLGVSKKDFKKAQNRKAAKKCRLKKKIYYQALEKENVMLKDKLNARFQVDEFTALLKLNSGNILKLSDFDVSEEDMLQRSLCILVNLILPDSLKTDQYFALSFDFEGLVQYLTNLQIAVEACGIKEEEKRNKLSILNSCMQIMKTSSQLKVLSKRYN